MPLVAAESADAYPPTGDVWVLPDGGDGIAPAPTVTALNAAGQNLLLEWVPVIEGVGQKIEMPVVVAQVVQHTPNFVVPMATAIPLAQAL